MSAASTIVITSRGTSLGQHWRELRQSSHLLRAFLRRDYRVRYAQTRLGLGWALLQPLLTLGVLYLVFSRVMKVDTGDTPYALFALSGIVVWNYFNYVVSQSASALINAQNMIRKIYFPRILLALSKAAVGALDFTIGVLLLLGLGLYQGALQLEGLLLFPLVLLATAISGLGLGLGVSSLSIRYRDLQQILPFFLQLLFFLSPIAYGLDFFRQFMGEGSLWMFYLNPISGSVELWRAFLFEEEWSHWALLSPAVSLVLLLTALSYFRRTEKKLADLL